jgi:hypothetical protein
LSKELFRVPFPPKHLLFISCVVVFSDQETRFEGSARPRRRVSTLMRRPLKLFPGLINALQIVAEGPWNITHTRKPSMRKSLLRFCSVRWKSAI